MNDNDAIEQAYKNGYEDDNKDGYKTGSRKQRKEEVLTK